MRKKYGKTKWEKNINKVIVQWRKDISKWEVIRTVNGRASRLFDTKIEAVEYARRLANNYNEELQQKTKKGKISESDTGGNANDPAKIPG